jgi:hypothetical protein
MIGDKPLHATKGSLPIEGRVLIGGSAHPAIGDLGNDL